MKAKKVKSKKTYKKWTLEEDTKVVNQVRALPQNLTKCFLVLSEVLDRTPGSIANHWYTVLSRDPKNMCFFTASPKHISANRKNGMGEESNMNVWKKLCKIIKSILG